MKIEYKATISIVLMLFFAILFFGFINTDLWLIPLFSVVGICFSGALGIRWMKRL